MIQASPPLAVAIVSMFGYPHRTHSHLAIYSGIRPSFCESCSTTSSWVPLSLFSITPAAYSCSSVLLYAFLFSYNPLHQRQATSILVASWLLLALPSRYSWTRSKPSFSAPVSWKPKIAARQKLMSLSPEGYASSSRPPIRCVQRNSRSPFHGHPRQQPVRSRLGRPRRRATHGLARWLLVPTSRLLRLRLRVLLYPGRNRSSHVSDTGRILVGGSSDV
jgi:hypothetical protein